MSTELRVRKAVPEYDGTLRSHMIKIPTCISECSGIRVFGRRIKSLAFTTDVAIIRNINADAVIAVYPFTPQPAIHRAVMQAADMPVFAGVGGGVTRGPRVLNLANDAEHEGAFGVVVNAPTSNEIVHLLKQVLDIPVVVTVVSEKTDVAARLAAGADILNITPLCLIGEIRVAQQGPRHVDHIGTAQLQYLFRRPRLTVASNHTNRNMHRLLQLCA